MLNSLRKIICSISQTALFHYVSGINIIYEKDWRKMTSRKINQLWFRSVPQNTITSVDIGNLRNGTRIKNEMGRIFECFVFVSIRFRLVFEMSICLFNIDLCIEFFIWLIAYWWGVVPDYVERGLTPKPQWNPESNNYQLIQQGRKMNRQTIINFGSVPFRKIPIPVWILVICGTERNENKKWNGSEYLKAKYLSASDLD